MGILFFFQKTLFHIIFIFWQCILTVSMSTSCCWYIIFTLSGQNTVTSVISSNKYQYWKYRKTIWTDLSNSNSSRPVLQIPQCIHQTSLNAPLRTEMCPSPLWTVHRGTLPRQHRCLSVRIPSARGGPWRTGWRRHLAGENECKWRVSPARCRLQHSAGAARRRLAEKPCQWQDTVSGGHGQDYHLVNPV